MTDAPPIAEAPPLDDARSPNWLSSSTSCCASAPPHRHEAVRGPGRDGERPRPAPPAEGQDLLHMPARHPGAHGGLHARHHHRERARLFQTAAASSASTTRRDLHLGPQDGGRVVRESRSSGGAPGADAARAAGALSRLVVSPLRSARLDPPDICLFYANPAQMILFINGLQWRSYRRYDFSITGESACADSWGHALKTREVSLSIPCYAERRYGGVADDEMLMACPPDDLRARVTDCRACPRPGCAIRSCRSARRRNRRREWRRATPARTDRQTGGREMDIQVSPLAVPLPELPPVAGVRLGAAAAGIRYRERTDLVMMEFAAAPPSPACSPQQVPGSAGRLVPCVAGRRQGASGRGERRKRQRVHRQAGRESMRRDRRGRGEAGGLPAEAGVHRLHRRDRRGAAARKAGGGVAGAARRPARGRLGGRGARHHDHRHLPEGRDARPRRSATRRCGSAASPRAAG